MKKIIDIIRIIPALVFLAVLLFLVIGGVAFLINKPAELPDIKDAPWKIQTYSTDGLKTPDRVYYAKDVQVKKDGTPVITDYWTYDGKRFKKHTGELTFPVKDYGNIGIKRRTG